MGDLGSTLSRQYMRLIQGSPTSPQAELAMISIHPQIQEPASTTGDSTTSQVLRERLALASSSAQAMNPHMIDEQITTLGSELTRIPKQTQRFTSLVDTATISTTTSFSEGSNGPTCRICMEPQSEETNPILALGCNCRGELSQAHQVCLEEWFAARRLYPQQLETCELCRGELAAPILLLVENAIPRVAAQNIGQAPWIDDITLAQLRRIRMYRCFASTLIAVAAFLVLGLVIYITLWHFHIAPGS